MKKLLQTADRYIESMTWKDITLLKICVAAFGFCAGLLLPQKKRRPALIVVIGIFVATYIPLLKKFIPILKNTYYQEDDDIDAILNEIDWDNDDGECMNMGDLRNAMLYEDDKLFYDEVNLDDADLEDADGDAVENAVDEVVQETAEEQEDGLRDEP